MVGYFAWFASLLAALVAQRQVHGSGILPVRIPYPSATNATSRDLAPEDEDFLIQILSIKTSEVESLIQSGRKFLQKVRQWQGSHPAESRLAKCVIIYCADIKIPGIVATSTFDDGEDYDGRRGFPSTYWITSDKLEGDTSTKQLEIHHSSEDLNFMQVESYATTGTSEESERFNAWPTNGTKPSFRSIEGDGKRKKLTFKRKAVKAVYTMYLHVRDLLSQYKLLGCGFHYALSKFWEWVDSAP